MLLILVPADDDDDDAVVVAVASTHDHRSFVRVSLRVKVGSERMNEGMNGGTNNESAPNGCMMMMRCEETHKV